MSIGVRGINKTFGTFKALDDISLEIPRGEFFGLLGPNGAGKSTLMSLVAGLRAPDAGTLSLDGALRLVYPVADRAAFLVIGVLGAGVALALPRLAASRSVSSPAR